VGKIRGPVNRGGIVVIVVGGVDFDLFNFGEDLAFGHRIKARYEKHRLHSPHHPHRSSTFRLRDRVVF